MQGIIIEKPYQFYPPVESRFWSMVLYPFLPNYLRKSQGVCSLQVRGQDRLRQSLEAGHGIMLTPNHCRPCDPMVLGHLARNLNVALFIMASRHLFEASRVQCFLLRRAGAFSLYREGMDREALKCAIRLLVEARRPLVLFPEGVISRTNDRLNPLMDGTSFIARNAARQRAALQPAGKVVIHPVALRYFFGGDIEKALVPVLENIEHRLSWQSQTGMPLVDRIIKVGLALLTLKELEYLDAVGAGTLEERIGRLINHLLTPLEEEWVKGRREPDVIGRVKALRTAILPDMVAGEIAESERSRRWRQLADCYLAQQLHFYPPDYFAPGPTPEKLLETVERFEEDLTDNVTIHSPVHAVIEVGEAIEINPVRERGSETDPVMQQIREQLEEMLNRLAGERPGAEATS
jgi:1-acyl-sn-glycerol-3-phosphate acyltransferase